MSNSDITDQMIEAGAEAIFDSINGKGAWAKQSPTSPHRRAFRERSEVCLHAAKGAGGTPPRIQTGVADDR